MGKRNKPMKPMYRTAAEEALILAVLREHALAESLNSFDADTASDSPFMKAYGKFQMAHEKSKVAVRAVVRERKDGKRGTR